MAEFTSSYLLNQWPNLKNLSGGLNLSRGLNMVVSTKNCIKCFKVKPGLNLNRVLADLNHGSNTLNSISEVLNRKMTF